MRKEYPNRVEWTNEQGQLHRLDGPAVEYKDGEKWWYLNGEHYSEQDFKKEIIKIKLKRAKNL